MTTVHAPAAGDVHAVALPGCRPEPAGSYLKALGLLRIVGTQADTGATGHWAGDTFVLTSRLDAGSLVRFLMDEYRPTPVMSPWNKSDVVRPDGPRPQLAALLGETDPRFDAYRRAATAAEAALSSPAGASKDTLVVALRARLPDEALAWVDAVLCLGDDLVYPPLAGSGGNDGRHEFALHFVQRLGDALGIRSAGRGRPRPAEERARWLRAALFDEPTELVGEVSGMLLPGTADVPSSPIGDRSVVNPWDVVLLTEGLCTLAAGVARRHGTGARTVAAPFTVRTTPVGNPAGAPGETSPGEVWLPLWERPATAAEVDRLMREGRCQWGRTQATDGLDAVRAVRTLGVDRGIRSFVRHEVAQRRGQSRLVQAAGRVAVADDPGLGVLATLDTWRTRLRGDLPNAVAAALGAADRAVWRCALHPGPVAYQQVLAAYAAVEAAVSPWAARNERSGVRPLSLPADRWLPVLEDGSAELRIALALAAASDGDGASLRTLLTPVGADDRGRPVWNPDGPPVTGFGHRPVVDVLADALCRRVVDVTRAGRHRGAAGPAAAPAGDSGRPEAAVGLHAAFTRRPLRVPAADAVALADGLLDTRRLETLLAGVMLLRFTGRERLSWPEPTDPVTSPVVVAVLACHSPDPLSPWGEQVRLAPRPEWARLLAAGRVAGVAAGAHLRLRMAGLTPAFADARRAAAGVRGPALAAACLVPAAAGSLSRLLRTVTVEPGDGSATTPGPPADTAAAAPEAGAPRPGVPTGP